MGRRADTPTVEHFTAQATRIKPFVSPVTVQARGVPVTSLETLHCSVEDILNYSGHLSWRRSRFSLRLECSGRHQHAFGENLDDVVVLQGIDFISAIPDHRPRMSTSATRRRMGPGSIPGSCPV